MINLRSACECHNNCQYDNRHEHQDSSCMVVVLLCLLISTAGAGTTTGTCSKDGTSTTTTTTDDNKMTNRRNSKTDTTATAATATPSVELVLLLLLLVWLEILTRKVPMVILSVSLQRLLKPPAKIPQLLTVKCVRATHASMPSTLAERNKITGTSQVSTQSIP